MVTLGETVVNPGAGTPPMPLSISTESALLTAPQLNTEEPPALIVEGDALNDEMTGVPLHPAGGSSVDVRVDVGVLRGIGVNVRLGV